MSLNDTTEYITRYTTATASIIHRTLRFIDITKINSLITGDALQLLVISAMALILLSLCPPLRLALILIPFGLDHHCTMHDLDKSCYINCVSIN